MTDWYDSPNITAILWAGIPGQESGNSITDILYGKINPGKNTDPGFYNLPIQILE